MFSFVHTKNYAKVNTSIPLNGLAKQVKVTLADYDFQLVNLFIRKNSRNKLEAEDLQGYFDTIFAVSDVAQRSFRPRAQFTSNNDKTLTLIQDIALISGD